VVDDELKSAMTDLKVPNFAVSATLELIEIFESEWLERGAARQRR